MFSSLLLASEFSQRCSVSIDGDFAPSIASGAFSPLSHSTCGGDSGSDVGSPWLGSMAGVLAHDGGQADVDNHGLDILLLCDVGGRSGGAVVAGMDAGLWSPFQGEGTSAARLGCGGSGGDEKKATTLVSFLAPLGFGLWRWLAREVAEGVSSTSAIVPA
ncbi:hypothetical protein ACLB2K_061342 [Fragaria x ananassa]